MPPEKGLAVADAGIALDDPGSEIGEYGERPVEGRADLGIDPDMPEIDAREQRAAAGAAGRTSRGGRGR